MIVTLWYGTVRLVCRTKEEKYGADIWVVLLLSSCYAGQRLEVLWLSENQLDMGYEVS